MTQGSRSLALGLTLTAATQLISAGAGTADCLVCGIASPGVSAGWTACGTLLKKVES